MRSRYAAYAKGLADYVMDTTDPHGPQWGSDRVAWRDQIEAFCDNTRFCGLVVLDAPDPEGNVGFVTFRAVLEQGDGDASFVERSRFTRYDGRWRYHSGTPVPHPSVG